MHTQILQILANVIESGMCQTRKSQWLRAHTHAKHNKVEWNLLLLNYNIRYSSDLYENLNFSHTNVIRFNIVIPKWRSGWRSSRESSWRKFTCFMSYSSDWEKKTIWATACNMHSCKCCLRVHACVLWNWLTMSPDSGSESSELTCNVI